MTDPALVVIASFSSRVQAELAHGALEAAGIESAIAADDAGGQYAAIALGAGGVRLLVRPEDREQAEDILSRASHLAEDSSSPQE